MRLLFIFQFVAAYNMNAVNRPEYEVAGYEKRGFMTWFYDEIHDNCPRLKKIVELYQQFADQKI